MKKAIFLLCTSLLLTSLGSSVQAGESSCQQLLQQARLERSFLKQRDMVKLAVEQCPDDPQVNFKHAFSLQRSLKSKEALRYYGRAVKLNPNYADAYFGMGDIYLELNQPKQAITAYEKGLEIDPLDTRAIKSLLKAKDQVKQQHS